MALLITLCFILTDDFQIAILLLDTDTRYYNSAT